MKMMFSLPMIYLVMTRISALMIPHETSILLSMKNEWGGESLEDLSTWNETTSPCTWKGIKCNSDCSVIGIFLPNAGLSNQILSALCELKYLTHLDLSHNSLNGCFPTLLYRCLSLQLIDLSHNQLDGPIPHDINKLSSSLQHLDLSGNHFSKGLPSAIVSFPKLEVLMVHSNHLSGELPRELVLTPPLRIFEIWGNTISGPLPKNLCSGSAIKGIVAHSNKLSGEISLEACTTLRTLNLSNNQFSGEIPPKVWNLLHLKVVDLSSNNLSAEIPTLLPNQTFNFVNLSNNQLSGEIPRPIFDNPTYSTSFLNTGLCTSGDGWKYITLPRCSASATGSSAHSHFYYKLLGSIGGVILFMIISVVSSWVIYRRRISHDPQQSKFCSEISCSCCNYCCHCC